MNLATLGLPGTLTSLLLLGLYLPEAEAPALDCTDVISYDFTTASAPFYPVVHQPNGWRDPDWLPPTAFQPKEAGFPNLTIARNAEIAGGELQYIEDVTVNYAQAIFGNIDTNATDWLTLFNTYGGTRTIHVEGGVDFNAALYAADLVGTGRIFTVYSLNWTGDCVSLIAEDDDGPPSGNIVLKLIWCINAGIRTTETVATKPRAWADGVHDIRVEMTPSTPQVPGSTINHTLNADGVARVYIDGVLEFEDTAIQFRTVVAYRAQINDAFIVSAVGLGRNSNSGGFVGGYTDFNFGYCDVPEPEEPPEPPTPGGELPEAIEPAVSDLPTGILRVFGLMTYGPGEVKSQLGVAETTMRDPASWYGGFKPAWLLDLSDIERSLSAQLKGVDVTLTVADPGGLTFRALAETTRLLGAIWEIFVVSDTVRYALGEPHRRFAGRVVSAKSLPGFRFEFTLVDILSEDLGPMQDSSLAPPEKLTLEQFPSMTKDYADRALQIAIGEVSDESEVTPVGVVPPRIVSPAINLTMFGGVNAIVVPAVLSHGALPPNGLWRGYYNTKTNPYTRIPIPPSAEGTILTWPGAAGWEYVGVATDYVDYPLPLSELTRRYTPVFFLASHPLVQAWLNKEIQVAFNVYGLTEFADGSGRYWSDAPDIFELLTRVFLVPPVWKVGDYPDIPIFFRGYSIVNHASIVKTRDRLRAFGGGTYPVGRLLGGNGQQMTMRAVQGELCEDVGMEQGIDRHGRYMLDVEDPEATATFQTSDIHDTEDGSFEVVEDGVPFRNNATFRYGERYLPAVGPLPAPAEGETMPEVNLGEHQDWTGIGTYVLDAAVTANYGKKTAPLELSYRWIRDSDVALNATQRKVARLAGPGPGYNGARLVQQTTTWRRGALGVELGDVGAITHIEGTGTGGYVGRRFRVEVIRDSLLARRISFAGRILPDEDAS